MKKSYVDYQYEGEAYRRYLKQNEEKTDFICPYDFTPVVFVTKGVQKFYRCINCGMYYESLDELKFSTNQEKADSKNKLSKLEKNLKEIRKVKK